MQQFIHVSQPETDAAYMPVSGFTMVDLGYQKGDAVSNFVTRFSEPTHTEVYLQLFEQIWANPEKVNETTPPRSLISCGVIS